MWQDQICGKIVTNHFWVRKEKNKDFVSLQILKTAKIITENSRELTSLSIKCFLFFTILAFKMYFTMGFLQSHCWRPSFYFIYLFFIRVCLRLSSVASQLMCGFFKIPFLLFKINWLLSPRYSFQLILVQFCLSLHMQYLLYHSQHLESVRSQMLNA